LVGKLSGKRPLGCTIHRWEDNIKMDLTEIELSGMDWIDPAQDGYQWKALADTVMNLRIP
jgi:hypothetical protein